MNFFRMSGWRGWAALVAGVVIVLGAILGLKVVQIGSLIGFASAAEAAGMPPVPVATVVADKQFWEETLDYPGTLRAVQGVTIRAELPGVIKNIPVTNGAFVKKGDLLVEYDVAPELAELESAEARLRLAKLNLDRNQSLLGRRTIAQSEFDSASATYDEAKATVANLKAVLDRKLIRAPFDARVGIREVNPGQRVAAGDAILPLQNNDPIYVELDVPQTRLSEIQPGFPLRVTTDGLLKPASGTITAINPVLDENTRSARVQGILENPEDLLRPGQFVRVSIILPRKEDVVAVPLSAIINDAYGASVFVVEDVEGQLVAHQKFVKLGRQKGDFVAILKGLAAGERVVSAGAFKLNNNAKVELNDAMQPPASLDPKPENS